MLPKRLCQGYLESWPWRGVLQDPFLWRKWIYEHGFCPCQALSLPSLQQAERTRCAACAALMHPLATSFLMRVIPQSQRNIPAGRENPLCSMPAAGRASLPHRGLNTGIEPMLLSTNCLFPPSLQPPKTHLPSEEQQQPPSRGLIQTRLLGCQAGKECIHLRIPWGKEKEQKEPGWEASRERRLQGQG